MKAFCLLALFAGLINASSAQSETVKPPAVAAHRFDEDWRNWCAAARPKGLERLKCIAPSDDVTLSLGGELRERIEVVRNPDFGLDQRRDHVFLHRAMLHGDLRAGEHVRAFVQLGAFSYSGREGQRAPFDLDRLDLVQGFVDLSAEIAGGRATLRGGRQEMILGSSRLVGIRESPNVRRAFDGSRVFWTRDSLRIDSFYLRPVRIAPGVFDDSTDRAERLWGVNAATPVVGPMHANIYYLGFERDRGRFTAGVAREMRHSLGLRLFGRSGGFDWDWEAVYQFGTFGADRIRAWTVATDTGFAFEHVPWRPRIGVKADIASGDRNPADGRLGTFNALYPKLPYFSEASLIAPANIIDLHPSVSWAPGRNVSLEFGWNWQWRASERDAVYSPPLLPIAGTAEAKGRRIGNQAILGIEWKATPQLTLASQYVHFERGEVLRQVGGQNVDFVYVSAALKF